MNDKYAIFYLFVFFLCRRFPYFSYLWTIVLSLTYPQYLFTLETSPFYMGETFNNYFMLLYAGCIFGVLSTNLKYLLSPFTLKMMWPLYFIVILGVVFAWFNEVGGAEFLNFIFPLVGYLMAVITMSYIKGEKEIGLLFKTLLFGALSGAILTIIEYYLDVANESRGDYVQTRSSVGQIAAFVGLSIILSFTFSKSGKYFITLNAFLRFFLLIVFVIAWIITMNKTGIVCSLGMTAVIIFLHGNILNSSRGMFFILMLLPLWLFCSYFLYDVVQNSAFGSLKYMEWQVDEPRAFEYEMIFSRGLLPLLTGAGFGEKFFNIEIGTYQYGCHSFIVHIIWQTGLFGLFSVIIFSLTGLKSLIAGLLSDKSRFFRAVFAWLLAMWVLFGIMAVTQNRFINIHHTPLIGVMIGLTFGLPYIIKRKNFTLPNVSR